MKALRRSLEENAKRLAQNPKAPNVRSNLMSDPAFNSLHSLTEFQQLTNSK